MRCRIPILESRTLLPHYLARSSMITPALQTAQRIVAEFFPVTVERPQVEKPRGIGGFSGTTIYRVTQDDETYCLKHLPQDINLARHTELGLLLDDLYEQGLEFVPVPLRTRSGSYVLQDRAGYWQMEPWMPGHADYWLKPLPERLQAAAQALARWHVAARSIEHLELDWFRVEALAIAPTVIERQARWQSYQSDWLEQISNGVHTELDAAWRELGERLLFGVKEFAAELSANLQAAHAWQVPLQPVLRDVWHDHVLFTGGKVSGLIDYGAARTDTVAADLSRLLGSLTGQGGAAWERALQSYEAIRPLAENERRLLPVLDLSNVVLSGLTWLRRRYVENATVSDPPRVLDRLKRIARRLSENRIGSLS